MIPGIIIVVGYKVPSFAQESVSLSKGDVSPQCEQILPISQVPRTAEAAIRSTPSITQKRARSCMIEDVSCY